MFNINNIKSCLIGLAVGDALGLPYERLACKKLNKVIKLPLTHRFLFGKGIFSDDTEHALLTLKAVHNSQGDIGVFKKLLKKYLIMWFVCLPAGIGLATLKSCVKLLLGFSVDNSGVFSAGNGPAMRSAIISAYFQNDIEKLKEYTKVSTLATHIDSKAHFGALVVGLTTIYEIQSELDFLDYYSYIEKHLDDSKESQELLKLIKMAIDSVLKQQSLSDFANAIGSKNGISGYMYHTVPCIIHIWLRCYNDYEKAITQAILAGGDTDTVASILGGIVAFRLGEQSIPENWRNDIVDYPININCLAETVTSCSNVSQKINTSLLFYFSCLIRNVVFFIVVFIHIIKRMFI